MGARRPPIRLKSRPDDFLVEERLRRLPSGDGHTLYRVRKTGVTSLVVRDHMAGLCGVAPRSVSVPALKDRNAVAVQHVSVPGRHPRSLEGPGYAAGAIATVSRPVGPRDVIANRFELLVRDLSVGGATRLASSVSSFAVSGLPNAFDRQRFGSYAPGHGFPGEAILRRDATAALRRYLWAPMLGDPPGVLAYKRSVTGHWGDWAAMFDLAPRPSNYRSLLTFLRDHPDDHRKALNLVPDRLLALWLSAYQSHLWNRALSLALEPIGRGRVAMPIVSGLRPLTLPAPPLDALASGMRDLVLPLPHARAVPADAIAAGALAGALREAGLEQGDLKARILRRAYLARADRAAWVVPADVLVSDPIPDTLRDDRSALRLAFTLPPGSYATFLVSFGLAIQAR